MNLLFASILAITLSNAPPLSGAMVMPQAQQPDEGMKDYLVARSYYKAQVSVKYSFDDHDKYVAELDAATARDVKNRYHYSLEISRQSLQAHQSRQRGNMMRIQQIREQEIRNRIPYKRAATHQQFAPVIKRYHYYPYNNRFHYWMIIR